MLKDTIEYLELNDLTPTKETNKEVEYELNQKEYAKIFTLLDRNESPWIEDSEELDNSDESKIVSNYYSNFGTLSLEADLDADKYKINIKED